MKASSDSVRIYARYGQRWILQAAFLNMALAERYWQELESSGTGMRDPDGKPYYYLRDYIYNPHPAKLYPATTRTMGRERGARQ